MNSSNISYWNSLLVLLLLLVAGQQHQVKPITIHSCQVDLFRLPSHIRPKDYEIKLVLNPDEKSFTGTVTIRLTIKGAEDLESTLIKRSHSKKVPPDAADPRAIVLNAGKMVLKDVLFSMSNRKIRVERICHDSNYNILVVTLEKTPFKGRGVLYFDFLAEVQTEPKGLFASQVQSGKIHLATYFKPNYARLVFPCFDEPEFKATFDLTIEHPMKTVALSNMKERYSRKLQGVSRTTRFEQTLSMSTYLLSFAVGQFTYDEKKSRDGMPISVHRFTGNKRPPSEIHTMAVQAYDMVADFFEGLQHPLRKIDILWVDMQSVAMEGWGLITIDLKSFTVKSAKSDEWVRVLTALMTLMIHQRLANLVTIRWWDELWLQESLAGYIANELIANMGGELFTLVGTTFTAMNYEDDPEMIFRIDGDELKKANELQDWYTLIAYNKSVAVMRMFALFFGKDNFKRAIHEFVRSNAERGLVGVDDWWRAFSSIMPYYIDMQELATKWITKAGYPTVYVQLNDDNTLLIYQGPDLAIGQFWTVPIKYEIHVGGEKKEEEFLLLESNLSFLPEGFNIEDETHWLVINSNYQGYYRVVYLDERLVRAQSKAISSGRMLAADQMQRLSDTYSTAKLTGQTHDLDVFLDVLAQSGNVYSGVMLLLTRILAEMQDRGILPLNSLLVSKNMMVEYSKQDRSVMEPDTPNFMITLTQESVLHFLTTRLNITEAPRFRRKRKEKIY